VLFFSRLDIDLPKRFEWTNALVSRTTRGRIASAGDSRRGSRLGLRGQRCRVHEYADGRIEFRHGDSRLPYRPFDEQRRVNQGDVVSNKRLGVAAARPYTVTILAWEWKPGLWCNAEDAMLRLLRSLAFTHQAAHADGRLTNATVMKLHRVCRHVHGEEPGAHPNRTGDESMIRLLFRGMALGLLLPSLLMLTACDEAPVETAEKVALFFDGDYVDVYDDEEDSETGGSEATNLDATVAGFDFDVVKIETGAAEDIESGTSGAIALLLPEPEMSSYDDAFDEDAVEAIADFVMGGGILIVFEPEYESVTGLLNDAFDTSIESTEPFEPEPVDGIATPAGGPGGEFEYSHNTEDAAGTPFETGAGTLPSLSATTPVSIESLPEGALCMYDDGFDACALAVFESGDGMVVVMGWDWYDAQPVGEMDSGWLTALRDALRL
jgi:hypothetical protein